jgi:hypothetical protein
VNITLRSEEEDGAIGEVDQAFAVAIDGLL